MNLPVFVVGCDRSGTTLLSLLLSQSPDLHMTLESGFIPELYEDKRIYGNFTKLNQRSQFIKDLRNTNATSKTYAFEVFELTDKEVNDVLENAAPTDYSGAVNALFTETARLHGKPRWGNKTPKYILNLDLINVLFPSAKIVHIIRDPRDVSSSMVYAGWFGGDMMKAAEFWNKRVKKGLKGRKLGKERYYELKYENLLFNTVEELKKLFNWLKISFTEEVIEDYKSDSKRVPEAHKELFRLIGKPIDTSRAYAWKKGLSKSDVARIEEINKQLIVELNYALTNYRVPLYEKLFRHIYHSVKGVVKAMS